MKNVNLSLQLLIVALAACHSGENTQEQNTKSEIAPAVTKIAFGSCSRESSDRQLWREVARQNPDLWIWLGDNVYGDTHEMKVLADKYEKQKSHPDYQELLKITPVIGTWDDHDYGVNDGGRYYNKKKESKNLLLNFLEVEEDAPVRNREGVYSVHDHGSDPYQVKVLLLDTRYFRDTLDKDTSRKYLPNEEGDILGEEQWQWLEGQLTRSKAAINIIGSSIQVIARDHGWEKWANFPQSRKRLFDLIARSKAKGVIFVSGDRHIAEISKMELQEMDDPLYDFTSSGLTHTWGNPREEKNQFRIGDLIVKRNFGLIIIQWKESPKITFQVRGEADSLFLEQKIKL